MRRCYAPPLLLACAALAACLPAPARCCPSACRCDRGFVYCNERNLTAVPTADIPADATVLYLQNNRVGSGGVPAGTRALLSVTVVYLFGNRLDDFPHHLPSSVRELHLQENNIRTVSRQALASVPALEKLHLDDNAIASAGIEAGAFRHLGALKLLFFSRNHLSSVPNELPAGLEELRLEDNRIASVSARAFRSMTKLRFLNLDGNLIADDGVESGAFRELDELTELSLSKNSLQAPPPQLPGTSLRKLLLHDNQIERVPVTAFARLGKLAHLDLSHNQLSRLAPGTFDGLEAVRHLNLRNNPWRCDCGLAWLRAWLVRNNVAARGTVCGGPGGVRGKAIKDLEPGDFACSGQTPTASADGDPSNASTKRWHHLATARPERFPPTEFPGKGLATARPAASTAVAPDEPRDLDIALKATSLSKDIVEVKWHDAVSVSAYKLSWVLEGRGPGGATGGATKTVILSGDVRLHLLTDLVPLASYRVCLEPIDTGNGERQYAANDGAVCTVATAGGPESRNAKVTSGGGGDAAGAGGEAPFPTAAIVGGSVAFLVAAVLLGSFCWYSHKTGKYLVSRWAFIRSRQKEGDYVESGTKKDNSILEMSESSYPMGAGNDPLCPEPYGIHPGYSDWTSNMYKLQPGHGPQNVRYIEERLLETHFIPV
ncbi:leucine-rich repeat transmembrane protein FLRT2 [Petromyzon marinus]|uniref:leucine-rich repeat transmembrane protein FLRT2 n=1 Tax=Petromyzon marinus TaxID=7757 RepID=UPI003F708BB5